MNATGSKEEVLKAALDTYGADAQLDMLTEECAELIQAVCKYKRARDEEDIGPAVDSLFEELADVGIMIDQMKILFDGGGIARRRSEKIGRLEWRLKARWA